MRVEIVFMKSKFFTHCRHCSILIILTGVLILGAAAVLLCWRGISGRPIRIATLFSGRPAMVAGNNKKTEEPKIAAPIGIDKKVFGSGEDPQFNVGELSAPKKIEVALANVASAVGKKDTKEITETGAVVIAPDGK